MKVKSTFHVSARDHVLVFFLACIVKDCFGQLLSKSSPSKLDGQLDEYLCTFCGTAKTDFLDKYCNQNFLTYGRCCLNPSNVTIGIDLGNCSLTNVPKLSHIEDISWLNFAFNPNLNCNKDNSTTTFKGFQNLQMIILPSKCRSCPGGNGLWRYHNRMISFNNCTGQMNNCQVLNRTCPTHSHCVSNGPGFYECLCSSGYNEYRCLIMNGMPLVLTLCAIAGASFVIIVPIWFLIRRRKKINRSGYVVIE
ncbi:all-trans retinoic acid-induced differentiation factor [Exaiptasia diaphana]|uniref:EGF-like domain-containing protein n=1 Tax=Exaiptasia diaphana TaxID=2652724 RepID=A0A913WV47_EXADI|nr:all-trans retinoic acid-induced differentiation factor [Exaiptasia diaphana]KXJ27845.1 All-trans retinoic acid-induced differentiation factor [Exaiptasia diaphana]